MDIIRITSVNEKLVSQINSLLDSGTVWDLEEGKKFLSNLDNALFLAFWEEEAAGFLTAHRLQRFDKRKAEVILYEIGVGENFRQKGIGKALIEEVEKWAKEVGADEVWVLTNKSNIAANAMYKSAGGVTENPDEIMYVFKL
jgi:GNAT superfamily N-acetyltransferase